LILLSVTEGDISLIRRWAEPLENCRFSREIDPGTVVAYDMAALATTRLKNLKRPSERSDMIRGMEEFFETESELRTSDVRGFSLLELAIVVTFFLLILSIALPQALTTLRAFRASSDARSIASQLALAKMRAANGFTQARLNCNLTNKSCQLEVCTSKGTSACNTFSAEGGSISLSKEMTFGFGSITTPAGSQASIETTAQILFNSRSVPIDNTGAVTGNDALYLTNQAGDTYAVTVYASGRIALWRYGNGVWSGQ
jgi:Tfp pilus assembly protein FimT